MHLKFLRHGQGRVSKAVDYVLGARDHKGEIRPGVRILGGDPGLMVLHGDSIERGWRYSSSMIAWHAQDQPTEDQVQGVLEDFVALAGAELADPVTGMTWLAVEHRSVDSVHVHVLVVREDATTGRASKTVSSVLGARDHKCEIRPGVRILGRDPGLMVVHGASN